MMEKSNLRNNRPVERASERASARSSERSSDRASERSSDRASERAIERSSDRATERPSDRRWSLLELQTSICDVDKCILHIFSKLRVPAYSWCSNPTKWRCFDTSRTFNKYKKVRFFKVEAARRATSTKRKCVYFQKFTKLIKFWK